MKNCLLFISLHLFAITISAQEITRPVRLKTGILTKSNNLRNQSHLIDSLKKNHYKSRFYTLIQFNKLPDAKERQALSQEGIVLYDYIPDNAYLAEVNDQIALNKLKKSNITGLFTLHATTKISPDIVQQFQQTVRNPDELIAVSFYGNIDKATVIAELKKAGAQIIETDIQPSHAVFIDASATVIQKIAALPFVSYISSQYMKMEPLNYRNRGAHSVNTLSAVAGRNLQGKNVTVGIGDAGDATTHIDLTGRIMSLTTDVVNGHSTHVTGTVAGAGIVNPKYKGMAPQATIISQSYSQIISDAPYFVTNYNMVLTNNSYSSGPPNCGKWNYDLTSKYGDEQLNNYTSLLHVFAAGNFGRDTCSFYLPSFGTVGGGFQSAKNVLTVGNVDNYSNNIAGSSSRGPVTDGRLKPEVVAGGSSIISTLPNNTYGAGSGTSMAAPTATGILALLYERYRQLHSGSNPSSTLMKAIACNGADDMGNRGPDFTYGFGRMNARNSVEAIENNTSFTGTIDNGGSATFTIPSVPAGTAQIKVLLCWNDPAASAGAASALVNNLDLTVKGPDAVIHYPLVLDPSAGNVNNIAVEGVDSRNNIEQVVIDNPPSGNVTVIVKGTGIAQGPQHYVVVYQVIQPGVKVEYPFGEDILAPGEQEIIQWSASDPNTNTFTIEYSPDNGSTWTIVNNSVAATNRNYTWTVPSVATSAALIRVSRNSTTYTDVSDYNFTILGTTTVTVTNICPGYANLLWSSIPSATSYDIMMLKGSSMQVIGTTTDTSYLLNGVNKDSVCWVAIRGVMGSTAGRRSIAQPFTSSGGACASPQFDNDLSPDLLAAPVNGRNFTSSQLGKIAPMVRIANLGNIATAGSVNISYQVNGGTPVTETAAINIAANSNYMYTFTSSWDFSSTGTYTIKVWINYSSDGLRSNDTLTTIVKHLQNDPIVLNPSFTEGFENATDKIYDNDAFGFEGLDRCEFNNSRSNGRARTFASSYMARTGNRAVILDQKYTGILKDTNVNSLITTFNLSNYNAIDGLWLSLYYRNEGIDFSAAGNKIWIRGSDQDAWIPVYAIPYKNEDFRVYHAMPAVNIPKTLANALPSQTVSSSFQVKMGAEGVYGSHAITYDDLTIRIVNDVVGIVLVNPSANECNLGTSGPIIVQVKNYSSSIITNVPVSYQVNSMTPVTENIPFIAPGDSVTYTFTQTADLSAFTLYTITAWTHHSTDNVSTNDTISRSINNSIHITSYPYLEGFEGANSGYWNTAGVNSSWQCGTPSGNIIHKAANGSKAWVTGLNGNYNNSEFSYLYSPCFDLSSLTKPVLSFSHIFKIQDNCDCDYHWVEYSTDGQTWNKLGSSSRDVMNNWYNNNIKQAWQASIPYWAVASIAIPTKGTSVRFRFVMQSDTGVTFEGIGIDDVHIYDDVPVFIGPDSASVLEKAVSGNKWIDFTADDGFGTYGIIASVNANGQDLGNTDVKFYYNWNIPRNDGYQFYLDRNIVIQPTNVPTGPVKVRIYFNQFEVDNIISAPGCSSCDKLSNAYEAGISQYSKAPYEEDGTLINDSSGTWNFIKPLSVIPFRYGYYAEYEVNNFSEFWINSGGPAKNQPLTQPISSFTVSQINNTALLQWSTWSGTITDQFIVERSTDSINYISLGTVPASVSSTAIQQYRFTDEHPATGMNYYRIKLKDKNGKFSYSPIRKLSFVEDNFTITVKPNPVTKGVIYISSTANCNRIELRDASGRLIKTTSVNGMQTQLPVHNVARGVYFITVVTDNGSKVKKLFIE